MDWLLAFLVWAACWEPLSRADMQGSRPFLDLLLLVAVAVWVWRRGRARSGWPPATPGAPWALAFLAAYGVSLVARGIPPAGFELVVRLAGGATLFVLLASGLSPRGSAARPVAWGLMSVGLTWAAWTGWLLWQATDWSLGRLPGLALPAWSTLALVPATCMALVAASDRGLAPLGRRGTLLLGLVLAGALALSLHRAAWLAVASGLAAATLVQGRRWLFAGAFLLALAGLGLTLFPALSGLDPGSAPRHLQAWVSAAKALADSRGLGLGPGLYPYHYEAWRTPGDPFTWLAPHNVYLQVALDAGLVGLGFWLALLLGLGRQVSRSIPRVPEALPALAALVGVAVFGFFHDEVCWHIPSVMLLWSVLGLAGAVASSEPEP